MIKTFINNNEQDICIAEVEEGQKYEIKIHADGNISFQYVITDDTHTNTYFFGSRMFKSGDLVKNIRHILKAEKTGHLCVRNFTPPEKGWKNMEIIIEEV